MATFLGEERGAFGVRLMEVSGGIAAAECGAGLFVRVDRRGAAVFDGAGDARDGGLLL